MPDSANPIDKDRRDTGFYEIEHTADYALCIRGDDISALLQNAAKGLYSLIGPQKKNDAYGNRIPKRMELAAQDSESLLVDWLSELAYWVETAMFIGTEFDFTDVSKKHLVVEISGWEAKRIEKQIKAVTYHNLKIQEIQGGLEATVVFDV